MITPAAGYDYRFVSLRNISKPAYTRVWAGYFYQRMRAPFRASLAWFDCAARRLLERPDPRGFALPVPMAVRALTGNLELTVPAAALLANLYPWVISRGRPLRISHYFLGDDAWSPLIFPFTEGRIYRETAALLAAGDDFRDADIFREFVRNAEDGRPERRNAVLLRTPALIDAYFRRTLRLVASVRERGLVRLREVGPDPAGVGGVRRRLSHWTETDIGVGIDHDGSLVRLPDAQHRSAVAMLLGLAAVPVELRLVHLAWLRRRMEERPGLSPTHALLAGLAAVRQRLHGGESHD